MFSFYRSLFMNSFMALEFSRKSHILIILSVEFVKKRFGFLVEVEDS